MIRFDEISGSDEITISPTLDTSFAEMSKPEAYSLGVDELLSEVFQDMSDPRSSSPLSVGDALVPPSSKKRKSSRRRSNNPAFHPEIRIFRRDIRRRYALMFGNVMNSCDSSLFSDFLKEFAVPHFEAHEEIPEGVEIKLIRMKVIRGQDEFVKFLGMNFTMMPDGVFRLSSAKVCQRLNSPGSRVVLHGSMLGTMLYEVIFRHLPQCNYYRNRMNIASI